VFFDTDRLAIRTIHENLAHTRLAGRAEVLRTDALSYLQRQPSEAFEYIFVAPPQYKGLWKETLLILDENLEHVHLDGIVVVQIDPVERQDVELESLTLYDERVYGNTLLWFFERTDPEDDAEDTPAP